jgi:hypothetical protein
VLTLQELAGLPPDLLQELAQKNVISRRFE